VPGPLAAAGLVAAGIALDALVDPALGDVGALGWLALAALAAARARGAHRAWVLVTMAGALLAALAGAADRRSRATLGGVDDRDDDHLVGEVDGPIEEARDGWRFALAVPGARVEVIVRGEPTERCLERACGPADLLPGDRIAVDGRLGAGRGPRVPGAGDRRRQLAARGVVAAMSTDWPRLERIARGRPSLDRLAAAARRALAARLPGDDGGAALLRALVLGVRGDVPLATVDAWRAAGTSHLLAVSGMHLAAVALLAFAILRRALALVGRGPAEPARVAALIAAPIAIGYTLVCGAPPSAMRALVAVLVYFAGVALGRRSRALDALGVAAGLLLALRPALLFEPGFQLSVAATLALALVGGGRAQAVAPIGRLARAVAALERAAWGSLRTSLAATLATAPITAAWFGTIQPAGAIANLVAAPLTEAVALPVGLAAALLGERGAPLAAAARFALGLADRVAWSVAAALPPWWCGAPRAHELVLAAALALAALAGRRRPRIAWIVATAAALGLVGSWLVTVDAPGRSTSARVSFVDVGQGDAALIEPPGGGAWLIDAGGRPSFDGGDAARRRRAEEQPGEAVLALLGERRIRRLELVVLSHPHPDHYLGLRALARRIPIDEIWLGAPAAGARPRPRELVRLLDDLAARGTRVRTPPLGEARRQAGATLEVLWPRGEAPGATAAADDGVRSVNDNSLVVRLGFAGRRVLFAGDLEADGEAGLVGAVGDLAADIVKVPHHGSATSSTGALIAASRPRIAAISCGEDNAFGFPSAAVVARWEAAGATVIGTDAHGTISATIEADGELKIESFE
jgi:competence protein ComEC